MEGGRKIKIKKIEAVIKIEIVWKGEVKIEVKGKIKIAIKGGIIIKR